MVGTKNCLDCGPQARDRFGRDKRRPDGLKPYCRECANSRWRSSYDRERRVEGNRRWRKANPEKVQAQSDRAQAKMTKEDRRRRYERSLDAHLRSNARRRALKAQAFVEDVDPTIVFDRDEGICGICDTEVDLSDFQIDHRVPLSKGGEHSYANVQVSHPLCNRRKGAKLATQLAEVSGEYIA